MTRKNVQVAQDWDVQVTGRHVMVTDPMKQYAKDKVAKIERFNMRIMDVHVTMDIQKTRHIVDIVLKVNDFRIKSSAVTDDMYASIDMAVDKVQSQLRKYKEKLIDRHSKGLHIVDMNVNVLAPSMDGELTDINDEIEEETIRRHEEQFVPHQVVNQETRPMKILTLDEAIMKMDLSGDLFLVYRCEEDQKIKVIYRRTDNHYGVIEPE